MGKSYVSCFLTHGAEIGWRTWKLYTECWVSVVFETQCTSWTNRCVKWITAAKPSKQWTMQHLISKDNFQWSKRERETLKWYYIQLYSPECILAENININNINKIKIEIFGVLLGICSPLPQIRPGPFSSYSLPSSAFPCLSQSSMTSSHPIYIEVVSVLSFTGITNGR